MDETLIERWNKVIAPRDEVWHLGDFNFKSKLTTAHYLERLFGRINIVWGNHDDGNAKKHVSSYALPPFSSAQEVKYLRIFEQKITLYHYAQRVWRNSHHGAWHLFGHSHNSLPRYHRSMDVGVDACNYTPISFEEIEAYMIKQPITLHHPELITDPWDKSDE